MPSVCRALALSSVLQEEMGGGRREDRQEKNVVYVLFTYMHATINQTWKFIWPFRKMDCINFLNSRAWWHTPSILALGRQGQENSVFLDSQGLTQRNPVLGKKKQKPFRY